MTRTSTTSRQLKYQIITRAWVMFAITFLVVIILPGWLYGQIVKVDSTQVQTAVKKDQKKDNLPRTVFFGYNTFNEVYAGFQIPRHNVRKMIIETGYQFSNSGDALYHFINPMLTLKASGLRARIGYQFPKKRRKGFRSIQFEYQDLRSVLLYTESGSDLSTVGTFKESYHKYGIKVSRIIPLDKGNHVAFVYSYAVFFMDVERKYITEGTTNHMQPSNRIENEQRPSLQLSVGVRFLL